MARRKLRKAKYESTTVAPAVHDRTTSDLPINARVAVDVVDDPYSNCGEKITVVRSVKDDPLAGMYSRQQIDWAQFTAGRMWQKFHEQSEIGSVSAIDPTKEAVDGGKIYQAFSDRQKAAMAELREAANVLGNYDNVLIWAILGLRQSLAEIAQQWGISRERDRLYLGARFRDALDSLAVFWRLSMSDTRACARQATRVQYL